MFKLFNRENKNLKKKEKIKYPSAQELHEKWVRDKLTDFVIDKEFIDLRPINHPNRTAFPHTAYIYSVFMDNANEKIAIYFKSAGISDSEEYTYIKFEDISDLSIFDATTYDYLYGFSDEILKYEGLKAVLKTVEEVNALSLPLKTKLVITCLRDPGFEHEIIFHDSVHTKEWFIHCLKASYKGMGYKKEEF